ncbi:MAG: ATP-binding protein [Acidimicrobiia bacterium]|nr:ATP-binding protein [Acidimicrobiia bacterium]
MYDLEAVLLEARTTGTVPADLLSWAESTGDALTIAAAYAVTAVVDSIELRLHESLAENNRAISIYETISIEDARLVDGGDVEHRVFLWSAYNCRAVVLDRLGRWGEAVHGHRQALALAENLDYERGMVVSGSNLGRILLRHDSPTQGVYQLLHPVVTGEDDEGRYTTRVRSRSMAEFYYACGLLEQAADSLAHYNDVRERFHRIDVVRGASQLAYIRMALGDLEPARRLVSEIDQRRIGRRPKVAVDFAPVKARLLGLDGRVDEGLAVLDVLAADMAEAALPETVLSSIGHPAVARAEILADAGRLRESLAMIEADRVPIERVTMSRLLTLRAEILAKLDRWEEALLAGREAEVLRRQFDVDADEYITLTFPDGYQYDGGRLRAHLADLYAREIHLRDVLVHDLRGHLASIRLAVESAAGTARAENRAAKLRVLMTAANRMADAQRNSVAYLRLVEGDERATPAADLVAVNLANVVDGVVERFAGQACRKSVEIRRLPSPDVEVRADRKMLDACLGNLVDNALKFTYPGTTVSVTWRVVESDADAPTDRRVEISVLDQGPGLTSDDLGRIFRNAQVLSARPTGGEPSTGLGLQIVTGFVNTMGGLLTADNDQGGGAVFTLSLPTDDDTVRGHDALLPRRSWAVERPGGSNDVTVDSDDGRSRRSVAARVLVFDDDPLVLSMMSEIVQGLGAEVRSAGSYQEAFDLIHAGRAFDLFILDVMVDGSPVGLQLADLAVSTYPDAEVVLATGLELDSEIGAGAGLSILRKPVRVSQLEQLVLRCGGAAKPSSSTSAVAPDVQPDVPLSAKGRIRLVREVAQGRELAPDWLDRMLAEGDEAARIDALIIAGVHEGVQGRRHRSLELCHAARRALTDSGRKRPIDLVWQLDNNIGIICQELGRHVEARTEMERALELAIDNRYEYGIPRSSLNLSTIYTSLGLHEAAIEILGRAATRIGADRHARAQLFMVLGTKLCDQGALRLGIAHLHRALDNLSAVEVDDTRCALQHLANAYLEIGDYENLAVVGNRLSQQRGRFGQPSVDTGTVQAIRAAIDLDNGDVEGALEAAEGALELLHRGSFVDLTSAASLTTVRALGALDRHQTVVDRWGDLDELAVGLRRPTLLLAIAESCLAVGAFEAAYRLETEAYRRRRYRNLGLGTLVSLAQQLSGGPTEVGDPARSSERGTCADFEEFRSLVSAVDDLGRRLDELVRLSTDAFDRAAAGSLPDLGVLEERVELLSRAVVELGQSEGPVGIAAPIGGLEVGL